MSSKVKSSKRFFFIVLFIFLLFTRLVKLDWGDGFFLNPDENNMAHAIAQLNISDLNPHFFAYGQFPLYLTFFSLEIVDFFKNGHFSNYVNFSDAIFGLRFWSSIFSIFSIYFFYKISQFLFKTEKNRLIFIALLIFNPGLIQMSHFGTTESILIFVFTVNIYLSLLFYKHHKLKYLILAGIISGIGLGTKITAIILTGPVFLSLLFVLLKLKKISKILPGLFIFLVSAGILSILLSPYNLLDKTEFLSSMRYEIPVANGSLKVFYTNQFLNTIPYWFQLKNIFPYTNGIFVFIFSLIGLILFFILKNFKNPYWLLVFIPSLVYFLYTGQLYTKWTRFVSPVFFVFPLLAALFISQFKNKFIYLTLIFISIIPGIYFINLYLKPDIRMQASEWTVANLPSHTDVLSEGGNVIDLPEIANNFRVNNFNFYELDNNPALQSLLPDAINNSNYIFIPSRRIYKNQANNNFPFSKNYYQNLFSGNLGFSLIKEFQPNADLILNPENAEETWTVFDHPTIRIYQKTKVLNLIDYQNYIYEKTN